MLRNRKLFRRSEGIASRIAMRSCLPVLLALILLTSLLTAHATVQVTTGDTGQLGNTLPRGNTSYVVYYSYPSVAQVGTNLTISLTLHINGLTGIIQYIINYNLEADVFVGTHELSGLIRTPPTDPNLYPGATWGPNNVTIPLTAENTGLAKGASANATIAIVLNDVVEYGAPIHAFEPEPALQGQGGSLIIQNGGGSTTSTGSSATGQGSGSSQSYLPYALLASGALLMIVAVLLPRGSRSPS